MFLTSLLSHLAEFGQGGFHIGKGADITGFRRLPDRGSWPAPFLFSNHRQDLARGRWPEKTTDCSQYVCQFQRSDWKLFSQKMTFFDFPGERVADAAIAAFSSFADWSEHILAHFARHHDYARAARSYLEQVQQDSISRDTLLTSYRETLARLILAYKPLISPSTFLLDRKGRAASPGSAREIAQARVSGLSRASQFAPLPARLRRKNPGLVQEMASAYTRYRKEVALPVFERISRTGTLVVLVDIPSLLAGGVGRYNDNRQILIDLFEMLRPGSSIGSQLLKHLRFWEKSLDRVAFVAAKADLVHPMDIENKRLVSLLKLLADRARRMLPGIEHEWFVCSACRSTFPVQGVRRLKGRLVYNNPEKEFREFDVPELPPAWPETWKPGEFPFYRVYPDAPENHLIPPRHLGLDRIFEFISR